MKLNRISTALFLFIIVTIASCTDRTKEINYNKDECDYCKMQISDDKYAAEIITGEEIVYKFDSIECLTGFALLKNIIDDETHSLLVNDYLNPGKFIEARKSFFVHNDNFMSPMGLNVQAFSSQFSREKFIEANGGKEISWNDVVEMVRNSNE